MRRSLVTTALLVGIGGGALAGPASGFDWGDSTETAADPGPAFESWLAETIDDATREADEVAAAARDGGIDVAPSRHETAETVHFRSAEFVSVLREDRAYAAGDRPDGALWLIPVNWDARSGTLIPIQSVLGQPEEAAAGYAGIADLLREAVADQVWAGQPRDWGALIEAAVQPDPMYLSTFTFVPSTVPDRIGGIAWHFEPATVAPGERGVISVVVPQTEFNALVAPGWRPMFEGQPADALNASLELPDDPRLARVLARL